MVKRKTPETTSQERPTATQYTVASQVFPVASDEVSVEVPLSALSDEVVVSVELAEDREPINLTVGEIRALRRQTSEGVVHLPERMVEGLDSETVSRLMDVLAEAVVSARHEADARERTLARTAPPEPYTAATDPDLIEWRFGIVNKLHDPDAMLARMEQAYLAGDRTAVMAAVFICCDTYPDFSSDEPFMDMWSPDLPDWVRSAFRTLYSEVLLAKANTKTWAEAFGSPHPKNRKLKAYRNKIQKAGRVYRAIQAARLNGEPLLGIGKEFEVGDTVAEEYQRLIEDRLYRPRRKKTDT
jgi:hypothetical protein